MYRLWCFAIAAVLAATPGVSVAQVFVDGLCCTPGSFHDLGNISSDGSGGRRAIVRPLGVDENGGGYEFFSTFLVDEDRFAELPDSPPQSSIVLTELDSLALTLPQLSHFPLGAATSVEHSISGSDIEVNASIQFLGWSTNWLAPPHEYVHDFGRFAAGDYRLTLNLERSDWIHPDDHSVTRGFIEFSVVAVPEPSTSLLSIVAAGLTISLSLVRTNHR